MFLPETQTLDKLMSKKGRRLVGFFFPSLDLSGYLFGMIVIIVVVIWGSYDIPQQESYNGGALSFLKRLVDFGSLTHYSWCNCATSPVPYYCR